MVNKILFKNNLFKFSLIIIAGFCLFTNSYGQKESLSEKLSFNDILRVGLMNNYNISLANSSLSQTKGSLMNIHGQLNPYIDLKNASNNGTDPTLINGNYREYTGDIIVPTSFGAYLSAGLGVERVVNWGAPYPLGTGNIPLNIGGVWTGFTLPLLRGLGKYNQTNASIFALRNYYTSKKYALSDDVVQYLRDVLTSYVQLNTSISIYQVRQKDVEYSSQYVGFIKEMIDHNQIAAVEIDKAQSFISEYKEKLLDAKNNVYNAYYQINKLEGSESKDLTGFNDKFPECGDNISNPDSESLQKVVNTIIANMDLYIEKSTYYQSLDYNQKGAEMEMRGARNATRNELDLGIRYYHYHETFFQSEGQMLNTFGTALMANFPGESVNITLSYHLPIKNEINKGNYLNKKANYEYQKTLMEKTKFEATNGVVTIISNLHNLLQLYNATLELEAVQQKTYINEQKKYKLGASSQLDIISAYQDFAESRVSAYQFEYNIYGNIIQLKYLLGLLPSEKSDLEKMSLQDILSISLK